MLAVGSNASLTRDLRELSAICASLPARTKRSLSRRLPTAQLRPKSGVLPVQVLRVPESISSVPSRSHVLDDPDRQLIALVLSNGAQCPAGAEWRAWRPRASWGP